MDSTRVFSKDDLTLDKDKLSGDNPEIYLLQWLTRCEQALSQVSVDEVKASQSSLESTLTNAVIGSSPFPAPGRPIRNIVARSLLVLFARGETRTLFDTLQLLSRHVNEPKSTNLHAKISCLYVIGEVMGAVGSQVMSFMGEVTMTTLKLAKQSSSPIQLRFHALAALNKSLGTAARAVIDVTARDIVKQSKNGLSDKALPIQRASAEVLRTMYAQGRAVVTVSEIEGIVSICVRGLEAADQLTRSSFADLVASILTLTQTEAAPLPAEASRKTNKKDKQEDDDDNEPGARASDAPLSTLMTIPNMLSLLSSWMIRPGTTRKMRVGITAFYAALFTSLGPVFIEAHYSEVVAHLMNEVVSHVRSTSSRQDVLLIRRLTGTLLREVIGVRMLSEQGQISAIRELSTSYLRKWPALMPGEVAPNPKVLVVVLHEVVGLLQQLGNAPPPVQDALSGPLIELLAHPNHSTRVAGAWALRTFCFSTPLRLAKSVINVMDLLHKDIASLVTPNAPADLHRRIIGHAHGLAALFSVIPRRPLYVSYDLSAKILDTAIQLLKRAGEHDTLISGVEIETAWICISSLMALGPNFVRAHLSQLLVLWRNALPKPTTKDTSRGDARSKADWSFLLRVRESALSAILNFLLHNSPSLVTLDVARRLSSLLSNALNFANAFVTQYREELRESPVITADEHALSTREAMLRRRVFQCFSALGFSSLPDSTQGALLESTIGTFASAEGSLGSSAQAAIASSSGTFVSVWQSTDGYAYGLTSIDPLNSDPGTLSDQHVSQKQDHLNRDAVDVAVDSLVQLPIIGSLEHDTLQLCKGITPDSVTIAPPAAPTGVVDAALELFSLLLPVQDLATIERYVSRVIDSVKSPKLERNAGRKSAAVLNAAVGFILALRHSTQNSRRARDTFGSPQISQVLAKFAKDALLSDDPILRSYGSEVIGRVAGLADASFLSTQIATLVDTVVQNRDPNGRAGCCDAFGSIYTHVGGLATGPLLKTTVNVLMSLSTDPHPTVHFHALTALAKVISAASLSYSTHISSTLGMLVKLYMLDSHEPEGGTLVNVNARGELPAYQVMCQIIDAVIGVLGPELLEPGRTRSLTLDLVNEFFNENDDGIRVEAIKCMQHLLIFGSQFMPITMLVARFRANLSSARQPLKLASINVLYALVQKDAFALSKIGGDRLVEELFGMLDDDASVEGVRSVIRSWLRQTVVHGPSGWIDLCQRIMSKSNAFQQTSGNAATGTFGQDDEGAALSVGMSKDQPTIGEGRNSSTSRWRTQLFALQCLHLICTTVAEANLREHLDLRYARAANANERSLLVSRVPDLVKMAFTASAAYVTDIRLEGLVLLQDIIQIFCLSPDPDYPEALLLEQYQAPITSALTPAFSSDSTPEILASAIESCAIFIGCGVIKEAHRMGRILKLLTNTLQQCKASGTLHIGEAQELSPNASVMLRVATLAAWAELEVASQNRDYLQAVLSPHRHTLASLWIASLRDYASIRADSEVLQEGPSGSVDIAYTGLGREVLLPYYADSWIKIMHAVAVAMRRADPYILLAMDGLDTPSPSDPPPPPPSNTRSESAAFYPIILGLVFEALVSHSADAVSTAASRLSASVALETLASLVRPEYSGAALFEPATFNELVGLFYRMTLTEGAETQLSLVKTIVSLVTSRDPATLRVAATTAQRAFNDDTPLTHCLRICAYVLRHVLSPNSAASGSAPELRAALVREGFASFMSIAGALEPTLRDDARSVAVLLYSGLLKNESSDVDLIGPSLPALKVILDVSTDKTVNHEKFGKLVHGLLSACLTNIDEMGGRQGPIPALKVKNNLLAAVLILTVVPQNIKLSQAAVEHCCFLIAEKLTDSREVVITAAHCAKTLIAAAAGGHAPIQPCIRLLIPGMIAHLADVAGRLEAADEANPLTAAELQGVDEVLKAFNTLFATFPEPNRPHALGILLPVLILLLDPAQTPPNAVHSLAITHLLGYATAASAAFKEAAGKLDAGERELLEASVRQAVEGMSGANNAPTVVKRQINLRTF